MPHKTFCFPLLESLSGQFRQESEIQGIPLLKKFFQKGFFMFTFLCSNRSMS